MCRELGWGTAYLHLHVLDLKDQHPCTSEGEPDPYVHDTGTGISDDPISAMVDVH